MIDKHNENLKELEASFSLPSKLKKQIQACINNLYYAHVFSTNVMNSLQGKKSEQKGQIGELIKLLYLLKRATKQFYTCRAILFNNKGRITDMIKEASVGSNANHLAFCLIKEKARFGKSL